MTKTITLTVNPCAGDRSKVLFRIRADNYDYENSWKLFSGRGTSGTLVASVSVFPVKNDYYNVEFCLVNDIYTFHAFDSYRDGWWFGSGYTLIQDDGEMDVEMEMLSNGPSRSVSVSTVFSTYLSFKVGYTKWKVRQSRVSSNWNTVTFDDSAWLVTKVADIPSTQYPVTFIRKSFELTGIEDYTVINIRMKYASGVAVYLNGNRVARYNLEVALIKSISIQYGTKLSFN